MEDKKRKINWFKIIMILLFMIFITLYISQATGYYDYYEHRKMVLTKAQMEKFEASVKKGENVVLNDYLKETRKDYNNVFSRAGLSISKAIDGGFDKALKIIGKGINLLFGE